MFSFFRQRSRSQKPQRRAARLLAVELLEDRVVPSTFTVANLADSGAGSLRQAILSANAHPGSDAIDFAVAGTIRLSSGALPAIAGAVDIDGTTAPGFAGQPVVEVDFNHFAGLRFVAGSSGSALRSLGFVNANGAGVTITGAGNMTVVGNYIGLNLDGTTADGNTGDGLDVIDSSGDTIGNSDPVTGISYANTDAVGTQPVTAWQGIRGGDTSGQYLLTGTSNDDGLLFEGTMAGVGNSYAVDYPGAAATSVYGPNDLGSGDLQLVGSYRNADAATAAVTVNGFLFQGTTADLVNSADYTTIDYPGASYNYVHSTMGGLAVGNYDSAVDHGEDGLPLGPGHAYIYDIAQGTFLANVVYPGSKSDTAYGIWSNGGNSYTICGGYSLDAVNNLTNQNQPIGQAYLVDYDAATGQFSHWTSFSYPDGTNFVTHFEGISSTENGVYTLNADSVQAGSSNPAQGSWVTVRRNADGSFGPATWVNLNYPNIDPTTNVTSSNAVYGNQVVGVVVGPDGLSYQATVNIGFQLSNVISGNGGNGIVLNHASHSQIAMNYIGTDITGTLAVPQWQERHSGHGRLHGQSHRRRSDRRQRSDQRRVRPAAAGQPDFRQRRQRRASSPAAPRKTQLSGNFIGTTASGDAALGNHLDGVDIVNANDNALIGCTFQQDPFVFYNVISGNGGNGLRNHQLQQHDHPGQLLRHGRRQQHRGRQSAQRRGGRGHVRQHRDGRAHPARQRRCRQRRERPRRRGHGQRLRHLQHLLRPGRVQYLHDLRQRPGRHADHLHRRQYPHSHQRHHAKTATTASRLAASAHGVRVAGNIIGLDTQGNAAMGNMNNGVEVDGNASGIIIGGPQPTFNIIPHNAISANGGNGVAVDGQRRTTSRSATATSAPT